VTFPQFLRSSEACSHRADLLEGMAGQLEEAADDPPSHSHYDPPNVLRARAAIKRRLAAAERQAAADYIRLYRGEEVT